MSSARRKGFTLVEVLIVIVIMAILAAVVIPQFSETTQDAKRSTAHFNLATMRSMIETYKGQHRGVVPAHDATEKTLPGLINKTRVDGTVDANGAYGPYVMEIPENPYTNSNVVNVTTKTRSTIASGDVTANNAGGWLYNATTGEVFLDSDPGFDF